MDSVWDFCVSHHIGLVVPGNEDPLVAGITDFIQQKSNQESIDIQVAGPDKYCSTLEGSKDFAKMFMMQNKIPTAAYRTFTKENIQEASSFLDTLQPPYVLKADGLAAGKGVIITEDRQEAEETLNEMIVDAKFGDASSSVVIEEFLKGIEISVFVVADGENYHILGSAKDYKRIGEGDQGPNTGGMGAISPVPFADDVFMSKVEERIIKPTLEGLAEKGHPYKGFLFLGLMNDQGEPKVIEYNVRMGDPETEAIFPRLKTDMLELLQAVSFGTLNKVNFELDPRTAATVFVVSEGYPGSVEKGKKMDVEIDQTTSNIFVFHAGVKADDQGNLFTNGGRVTAVTVLEESMIEAMKAAQLCASAVKFEGANYRKDIGQDLIKYEH
jgi:phosphoribosylamine--glycine ligase